MDFDILYWIQNLRSQGLDSVMVKVFNDIVGAKGEIWLYLGILLLIVPKTRKVAVCLLSSYILAYFIGDGILKDLIARQRPCMVDESVELLIKRPTSFSCPSVHSMLAFASAGTIFWFNKKWSIPALVFAVLIGLSRMYFFVHFPTDVLFGAVLGFAVATIVCLLYKAGERKKC